MCIFNLSNLMFFWQTCQFSLTSVVDHEFSEKFNFLQFLVIFLITCILFLVNLCSGWNCQRNLQPHIHVAHYKM
jgi:hypothetical protein